MFFFRDKDFGGIMNAIKRKICALNDQCFQITHYLVYIYRFCKKEVLKLNFNKS